MLGVALEVFRWNQLSNAALGRLAFPAISAVGILLALGWSELSSWRLFVKAKWVPALFPAGLIMLSIIAEPVLLSTAFGLPQFLTDDQLAHQPGHPIDIRYGNVARLVRIDVPHSEWPHPGETSAVRLCWDALAADPRELLVVVQFVGPADQVVAVRRMHPGLGNYPTRLWQSGARFCDELYVPIQPDAPAPAVYDVDVGFFDQQAYQRLPTYAANNAQLGSNFVERVKVAPRQYTSPTIERELNYRLGDQIELIGYALDPASIQPGESIHLRLYWRALRQPDADYTVFAHVRDAAGNIAAQLDSPPQLGAYPTSFWDAGEIVTDDRSIQIAVNARAGDYTVNVGLYRLDNGERLPVTSGGSGTEIVLPLSVNVR